MRRRLPQQPRPGFSQPLPHRRILSRHITGQHPTARGREHPTRQKKILDRHRYSAQRADRFPLGPGVVGAAGGGQRQVRGLGDEGADHRLGPLDPA